MDQWVALWVILTALLVHLRLRRQAMGSGLVVAYLLNLWAIHGFSALLYTLPKWRTADTAGMVALGFQQATLGLVAAATGSALAAPWLMRLSGFPPPPRGVLVPHRGLIRSYVAIGLLCYLILLPRAQVIPTATAIVAAGWRLLVIGLGLAVWLAWQTQRRGLFALGLLVGLLGLPFMTIVSAGFLSFGSSAALALFVFTANLVRPRWKILLASALVGFLGLSFYVTYMRDRAQIRETVWGRQSTIERLRQLQSTLMTFEWFDASNEEHFWRVDDRLNQNLLVGAAVQYLDVGLAELARGETVWQSALALVPRALWPGKPMVAGSGNLVSDYTGILFAEDTSVGIGQVMELYINFGWVGVFVGFLIFGTVVAMMDSAAGQRLRAGDWQGFTYWYLPGLSLLDAGGSLMETTSSTAAGIVTVYLVNRYLLRRFRSRRPSPLEEPGEPETPSLAVP